MCIRDSHYVLRYGVGRQRPRPGFPSELVRGHLRLRGYGYGSGEDFHGSAAVSYTHLDVYKRQGVRLLVSLIQNLPTIITTIVGAIPQIISSLVNALINSIPQIIQAGVQPVSYTHLGGPRLYGGSLRAGLQRYVPTHQGADAPDFG